jgi:hypothetical protein
MGQILTIANRGYDAIRALLGGVDAIFLTDIILDIMYVPASELVIMNLVKNQNKNGVRTVSEIIALSPLSNDYIALYQATVAYAAYITTPAMGNLVNTSVSLGEQTLDLGGVGDWKNMGKNYQEFAAYFLSFLENWLPGEPPQFKASGPVKAGLAPNTLSGFRSRKFY